MTDQIRTMTQSRINKDPDCPSPKDNCRIDDVSAAPDGKGEKIGRNEGLQMHRAFSHLDKLCMWLSTTGGYHLGSSSDLVCCSHYVIIPMNLVAYVYNFSILPLHPQVTISPAPQYRLSSPMLIFLLQMFLRC